MTIIERTIFQSLLRTLIHADEEEMTNWLQYLTVEEQAALYAACARFEKVTWKHMQRKTTEV